MNGAPAAHDAVERAARESYGKLLAFLARRCGSVGAAEDALSDAFAGALERWPADGVPRVPEAWLLVTARHRLFDRMRRERRAEFVYERMRQAAREAQKALDEPAGLGDERLGLLFACAHPAIPAAIRAPLMLQVVVGIDAARIASAFLVAPATMSQRLVRAKAKLASAEIPLHVPPDADLSNRLDSVLEAIYAAFSQDDSNSSDPRTRGLAVEALWLGTLLANLCPNEPEAMGLLALMEYAAARSAPRRDVAGRYVPLDEQDVSRWDSAAVERAETLLERAATARRIGRFQLEAAIQSAHMARRFRFEPDWKAIVTLYDDLLARTGSPVVALNRAVALGRLHGARSGLDALAALTSESRLQAYQPYWAGRAHLSAAAGDVGAARTAYARAIGLTVDPSVRTFLESRLAQIGEITE